MNFQYEYVASALSHVGAFEKEEYDMTIVDQWINKINKHHNHYVSVLFNAYTEGTLGKDIKRTFPSFHHIYSDSGGLQMVSLGHGKITDEQKNAIYQIQGTSSDVAMCFDEVPVIALVDKKKLAESNIKLKTELKNSNLRLFDPDQFDSCAKETAKNILNQIKFFDKIKSKTKIIVILQGNDTNWYQKWLDIIMKNIPKEEWIRLGGIAFGSPAYGGGLYEDTEKLYFISKIQAPSHMKKHFHLLGVGSINRLYPLVPLRVSGLIPKDTLISYDSSKHTGGVSRGDIQIEHTLKRIYRSTRKHLQLAENTFLDTAKEINFTIDNMQFLHDVILFTVNDIVSKYGDTKEVREKIVQMKMLQLVTSINNLIKTFNRCHLDFDYFKSVCEYTCLHSLGECKTWEDFRHWQKYAKSELPSNKIEVKPAVSLDSFM